MSEDISISNTSTAAKDFPGKLVDLLADSKVFSSELKKQFEELNSIYLVDPVDQNVDITG